jgi:carboxylate-amine ligase
MGSDANGVGAAYDEDRDEAGSPREGYEQALGALNGCDLGDLSRAVARRLDGRGVSFGPDPFVVDPVPRLLRAAEWDPLAAGLAQRARALNALLRDAYGERRIVGAGVIPEAAIERAEGYEPDLRGRLPQHGSPAAIIGFDVVRDPDGEFLVLEDNLRTPSGFAYALAARAALTDELPPGFPASRPIDPLAYELLDRALRAAAPAPGGEQPVIAIVTDGPSNVAYYEHEQAARRIGAVLATPDDLVDDGERVSVKLPGGGSRPLDVVYRRTNIDAVRDDDGELTDVARVLLEPWLAGRIGLVNGFGNGLADDKFIHGYVEDCIRFYLGEEPLVRSVPTRAIEGRPTVDELRELVVKPRAGFGGEGVVIGAHAETGDLERLAGDLEADPEHFIAQPIVTLSRHPTVIDGRLEPRHVDLRAFAFCGDDVALLPGGLTRVALDAGTLVVNSSQHGGGKDTRVFE